MSEIGTTSLAPCREIEMKFRWRGETVGSKNQGEDSHKVQGRYSSNDNAVDPATDHLF